MPVVTDPNTGVSFFDEGETDADGNLLSSDGGDVSDEPEEAPPEPQPKPRAETPRFANPNARRPAPPHPVEVVKDEPAPVADEPDEDPDADAKLDEYIAAQVAARVAAEASKIQSTKDKEVAKAEKQAQVLEARLAKLEEELEAAKLEGLTDDEIAAFKDSSALEKKRAMLNKQAEELAEIYKERQIEMLVGQYGYAGVDASDLEDIDDPDQAEKFCKQAEKFFLKAGGKKPGDEVVPPPKPKAQVPAPKPAKPVPAGATARSDVGGESPPLGKTKKFNEEQTTEAMAQNLNNAPWVSIRL